MAKNGLWIQPLRIPRRLAEYGHLGTEYGIRSRLIWMDAENVEMALDCYSTCIRNAWIHGGHLPSPQVVAL
jgi:hypothetical protein